MLQFLIYTMVVAPLFWLGIPEWMARRIMAGRLRLYRLMGRIAQPVVGGVLFNFILIATHSPWAVDNFRPMGFGSFPMDFVWFIGGLLVWAPIVSPITEHRMTSYPGRMAYLFLALEWFPQSRPVSSRLQDSPYAIYELAPRVHGLSATTDQQLAGLVMKLGGIPVVWGTIVALMYQWSEATQGRECGISC